MRTTLMIPDPLMRRLKREAARQRTTISALVEQALRLLLDPEAHGPTELPPLSGFHGGRARVDVANREALHSEMDRP
ncbi:MAG: ribbon-helix-helix domain-containing protein [Gemmatimonadota bacterium]